MSLRPRDPNIARIARAGQRMAPGGRRWSESPIPRPAVRRVRAGKAPVNPPTLVEFQYTNGTRGAATVDVLSYWDGTPALAATDMVAVVMVTEGVPTPPSGWRTLRTHRYTDFGYYVAVIDSATGSDDGAWAMDWTGVAGLKESAYIAFQFGGGAVSGLTWDLAYDDNDGATGGTFLTPTDPAWLYSVAMLVQEDCEWNRAGSANTHGFNGTDYGAADTNAWVWLPTPNAYYGDPAYWEPGATVSAVEWAPDQVYTSGTGGYSGTPSNSAILLGVKPS